MSKITQKTQKMIFEMTLLGLDEKGIYSFPKGTEYTCKIKKIQGWPEQVFVIIGKNYIQF